MSNASSYESNLENSFILNANLDALKKSASNMFQVQCTSIQEFNEGGFHKVYILEMEDESEVAVMKHIHLNMHIPVPKVYYWNSFVNNLVGTEYILIEYLPGIRLCDIWSNLNIKKKKKFLLKIIDIQLALKKLKFLKIGSIFFNSKNDQFKIGQDDGNDMFVLTYIDFYMSNILVKNDEITGVIDWECSGAFLVECLCTYPVWITNNPMIEQANKNKMSHHDPDFICTMDNIDKEKKNFILQCLAKKVINMPRSLKIDDYNIEKVFIEAAKDAFKKQQDLKNVYKIFNELQK
ncbi:5319_t:CDS:2 [Gigaspora margarita]|uniref:5319_t:CDS:1 n=1 Tax=Gigaspora margarita TaxID=4874 RepID=A0ABN7UBM9_GIGMA|nr:5319_t:CDS:2 [Gigaspora margarita]